MKRLHILPEIISTYLPNSFAVLSTESQLGDTKLLNPFWNGETVSVLTTKILVQMLFFVVAEKNPVLTHPVALHFKNISHDLFSESWWKSHLCLSTCLNIVPSQSLDQYFQARQYIWLTLTVLSCFGIQGTENRILYDWKYWLLVGVAHTTWFNKMKERNHFDEHGKIHPDNNLAKRYAMLLKAYWIPITAATAATFYEARCAQTGY
ncbi:hypothetical protein IPH25_01680 [bacterium]|nr:MAG: hypothetical protein IPG37_03810 [bacterium]QQR62136.1 MAG: hypothetical protein IPH25_01680 [bacterium]QQR63306.1 MAG: hypothetical protein IPH67_02430 [bacterium]